RCRAAAVRLKRVLLLHAGGLLDPVEQAVDIGPNIAHLCAIKPGLILAANPDAVFAQLRLGDMLLDEHRDDVLIALLGVMQSLRRGGMIALPVMREHRAKSKLRHEVVW